MEKLELINSLRKKIGHYLNPKLRSFKICQNDRELFVELQTNLKAPMVKKNFHYCNLLVDTDFGKYELEKTIRIQKEITDNATTLLDMKIFQLFPDFPELFKSNFRNSLFKQVNDKRKTGNY